MEWPKLFRDVRGMKVRTKHELRNGWGIIPVGTVGFITNGHQWDKMEFTAAPCECCGIQMRMSGCGKYAFEPLEAAPPRRVKTLLPV